jgi:hypothetical protein
MDKEQFLIMKKDDLEALFTELLDRVAPKMPPRFIPESEARKKMNCGKTQLYHYRVSGKISFFQDPDHPKLILYDSVSIDEYLTSKSNLHKTF